MGGGLRDALGGALAAAVAQHGLEMLGHVLGDRAHPPSGGWLRPRLRVSPGVGCGVGRWVGCGVAPGVGCPAGPLAGRFRRRGGIGVVLDAGLDEHRDEQRHHQRGGMQIDVRAARAHGRRAAAGGVEEAFGALPDAAPGDRLSQHGGVHHIDAVDPRDVDLHIASLGVAEGAPRVAFVRNALVELGGLPGLDQKAQHAVDFGALGIAPVHAGATK